MKAVIAEMERRKNPDYYDQINMPQGVELKSVFRREIARHGETYTQKMRKRASTAYYTVRGESLTITEIAEKYGIKRDAVRYRAENGFRGEDLINDRKVGRKHFHITINGKEMTYREIAEKLGMSVKTLYKWKSDGIDIAKRVEQKLEKA